MAPFGTPRERLRLAVQSLNDLCASEMRLPARGVAALGVARRFASAPIIRCRSAHLVEVQPNFCLLWICTILLMPAKAALLRSPHFNRKNDRVSGRFRSFYQFVPEDNRR